MSGPMRRGGPRSSARIFGWPLAIGTASVIGLLSALVGDGIWNALSWLLLGGTVALLAVRLLR